VKLILRQNKYTTSYPAMAEMIENENVSLVEATESAMTQVFNIPELLDLVLSHLPASDLFAMVKVNRRHRAGVFNSSSARRTLFLSPRPALPGTWSLGRRRADKYMWAHSQAIELSAEVCEPHLGVEPVIPTEACPLLFRASSASRLRLDNDTHPQDTYVGLGERARLAFQPGLYFFDEKGFEEWTDVLTVHKRAIKVQVCFSRS
jgi:hypothetical protein